MPQSECFIKIGSSSIFQDKKYETKGLAYPSLLMDVLTYHIVWY